MEIVAAPYMALCPTCGRAMPFLEAPVAPDFQARVACDVCHTAFFFRLPRVEALEIPYAQMRPAPKGFIGGVIKMPAWWFALLFVTVMGTQPAWAQVENTPGSWTSHRSIADAMSTAAVFANVGLETWHSWQAEDRRHAFGCQGLRLGLTVGVAELTKRFVHRTRPDGSDQLSFFSEHTAVAAVSSGYGLAFSLPLSFLAGYGRLAANKHHPSDVVVGATVGGAAARFLCH